MTAISDVGIWYTTQLVKDMPNLWFYTAEAFILLVKDFLYFIYKGLFNLQYLINALHNSLKHP